MPDLVKALRKRNIDLPRKRSIKALRRRDHRATDRATGALAGSALVAGAWFFLDPHNGARRRHVARDRAAALVRARKRDAGRKARYAAGVAQGAAYRAGRAASSGPEPPRPDDVTLARKVETEIFRPADAPKGAVDVNVDDGVVFLRGTLDDKDKAEQLAAAAERVDLRRLEPHPRREPGRGKSRDAVRHRGNRTTLARERKERVSGAAARAVGP